MYLTEGVSRPPGRYSPPSPIIRVGPEQIAHGPLVGNLLEPVQGSDVVQGVDAGRESAMKTEDLTIHESCERKVVKQVGEVFPDVGIAVLPQAFIIEPVHLPKRKYYL